MEQEAYFVWVLYGHIPLPNTYENNQEIYTHEPKLYRVALRKGERNRLEGIIRYKRVCVEFDPIEALDGKPCFVVVIRTEVKDGGVIIRDTFHFAGVTRTQLEADQLLVELESGKYKTFLEKKQRLFRIEIIPSLFSEI